MGERKGMGGEREREGCFVVGREGFFKKKKGTGINGSEISIPGGMDRGRVPLPRLIHLLLIGGRSTGQERLGFSRGSSGLDGRGNKGRTGTKGRGGPKKGRRSTTKST